MQKKSRQMVDLLKRLIKDQKLDDEARRRIWMRRTGRSRARFFEWQKVAIAELEHEAKKRRQRPTTDRTWPLPPNRDNSDPKDYPQP